MAALRFRAALTDPQRQRSDFATPVSTLGAIKRHIGIEQPFATFRASRDMIGIPRHRHEEALDAACATA